jgi:hypothetical protein
MVTLINCISITDPWGHVGTVSRVDRDLFCLLARTSYVELPGQAWSIRICKNFQFSALFRFNHARTSDLDTEYHPHAYSFPHTTY